MVWTLLNQRGRWVKNHKIHLHFNSHISGASQPPSACWTAAAAISSGQCCSSAGPIPILWHSRILWRADSIGREKSHIALRSHCLVQRVPRVQFRSDSSVLSSGPAGSSHPVSASCIVRLNSLAASRCSLVHLTFRPSVCRSLFPREARLSFRILYMLTGRFTLGQNT